MPFLLITHCFSSFFFFVGETGTYRYMSAEVIRHEVREGRKGGREGRREGGREGGKVR